MESGENMVFKKLLENLKNGVKINIETVDITDDFKRKYEEYQEKAKNRNLGKK